MEGVIVSTNKLVADRCIRRQLLNYNQAILQHLGSFQWVLQETSLIHSWIDQQKSCSSTGSFDLLSDISTYRINKL